MKLINDSELEEFVDENGDKLFCYPAPRRVDVLKRNDLYVAATAVGLNEDGSADVGGIDLGKLDSVKLREHSFAAVVAKVEVNGNVISGKPALLDFYRMLDDASGEWVDEQVDKIWNRLEPGEEKKE